MRFARILPAVILLAAIAVLSPPASDARADITRGPYIQNPSTDGITVMWRTDESSPSVVLYWKGASDIQKAMGEPGTLHEVTLSGLKEDTKYHYRVLSGTDMSEQYTFRTMTHKPGAFRFVAFGDSRGNDDTVEEISGRVSKLDPPAAFAIHTGDIVDNGREEEDWDEQFFEPQHPMMAELPVYFAMGNHDHASEQYFRYLAMPGNERWYAFEYADAVFISLDTTADYAEGSPQYDWFASTLEGYADRRWKFVYFHNPPYSTSYHGPDKEVQKSLVPLIEKYGVDIVFNGHEHNYERTVVNGVTYVVTGGYGAPRYPKFRHSGESKSFSFRHHFCVIDVSADSAMLTVIDEDGDMIEEVEIGKGK